MKKLIIVAIVAASLVGCDDKETTTALQPQDQPAQMAGDQQSAPAQVSPQNGGPSDSQTVVVNGGGGGNGGGVGDFATGMLLGHMMGNAGNNNGGSHTREVIRERTIVQKPSVTRSAPRKEYYGTTTTAAPKKSYSAPRSSFSSRSYSSSKSYSAPRSSYRSSYSSSFRRR